MNPSMPSPPEYDTQERALRQERGDCTLPRDPQTDAYRLVHRAIDAAPMPAIPADFAARMAAQVTGIGAEDARLESLLQRIALMIAVAAALLFSAPYLMSAGAELATVSRQLPMPILLASGIGMAVAAGIDRLLSTRHQHA